MAVSLALLSAVMTHATAVAAPYGTADKAMLTPQGDILTLEQSSSTAFPIQRFDKLLRFSANGTHIAGYMPLNIGAGHSPAALLAADDFGNPLILRYHSDMKAWADASDWTNMEIRFHSAHLIQLSDSGSIDRSFGVRGHMVSDLVVDGRAWIVGVLPMKHNRPVVAGTIFGNEKNFGILAAFSPDGQLDESFGDQGRVNLPLPFEGSKIQTLLWDKRGSQIYVAGVGQDAFFVLRFMHNGIQDVNFGNGGIATIRINSPSPVYTVELAVDGEGRLVAVGTLAGGGQMGTNAFLARLLPTGAPDQSFGTGGVTLVKDSRVTWLTALKIASDNSIFASGNGIEPDDQYLNPQAAIMHYTAAGTVSPDFGDHGLVLTYFGALPHYTSDSFATLLPSDSHPLIIGNCLISAPPPHLGQVKCLCMARLNKDGSPDETFGDRGLVRFPLDGNPFRADATPLTLKDHLRLPGPKLSDRVLVKQPRDQANLAP